MAERDPFDKARLTIAYIAIAVWVLSWAIDAIAQISHLDYDTPGSVPTIAVGVAVFMFGAKSFLGHWRKNGNGKNGGTPA